MALNDTDFPVPNDEFLGELVPPVDEPEDPQAELDRVEDALEIDDLVVGPAGEPHPVGRSWAFDWEAHRFVRAGSGPLSVRGQQTLREWVQKCLVTAKGAHPVHSDDYGVDDPWEAFGRARPTDSDLRERVTAALLFHPAITDVRGFETDFDDEGALTVRFDVLLDDANSVPVRASLAGVA